jgi:hypothetical protein
VQPIDITQTFDSHPLDDGQRERFAEIREASKVYARVIDQNVPDGPGKTLALRHVEDAHMRARHTIANENNPPAQEATP